MEMWNRAMCRYLWHSKGRIFSLAVLMAWRQFWNYVVFVRGITKKQGTWDTRTHGDSGNFQLPPGCQYNCAAMVAANIFPPPSLHLHFGTWGGCCGCPLLVTLLVFILKKANSGPWFLSQILSIYIAAQLLCYQPICTKWGSDSLSFVSLYEKNN